MSNLETVRDIYGAFGRGDVEAILARVADDVEWEYGVNSTTVPRLQPRRGKEGVMAFLQALGSGADIQRLDVKTLMESGHTVVTLLDLELTVRATGRRVVEEDEVHIWPFAGGKVRRFRHRANSHQHQVACDG